MNLPLLESLEARRLLSGDILPAHQAVTFDSNNDGCDDIILVNNACSDLEYSYSGGEGFDYVKATADGASFTTNTFVSMIDDVDTDADFHLDKIQLGTTVRYGWKRFYSVDGQSSIMAASVNKLLVCQGDIISADATEGGFNKIKLYDGDLYGLSAMGDVDKLSVNGDILGSIYVAGSVDKLSFDDALAASIVVDGDIEKLCGDDITDGSFIMATNIDCFGADTISGYSSILTLADMGCMYAGEISQADITVGDSMYQLSVDVITGEQGSTTVSVAGSVNKICAGVITGGENGYLGISIGAGLGSLYAGVIDGGLATDGGYAGADISVIGSIDKLQAGMITGGTAADSGAFAMLTISVDDLWGTEDVVSPGDIVQMYVSIISGGEAGEGADAMLNINIANDLGYARVGQMIGAGRAEAIVDPSIYLNVGHNIECMVVGVITAGETSGDYSFASVNIFAGNDIKELVAGEIDAGTANGDGSEVMVNIFAGRDIQLISAGTISGGISNGSGAMAGVYIDAARNIGTIAASQISGTSAHRPIADPTVAISAGGDIGCVMAGVITGGEVISNGDEAAMASVSIHADGTYVDEYGVQSEGNIEAIFAGTIRGGDARGEDALAFVDIYAANDIKLLCADTISGGSTRNNGMSYVSILAQHDIVELYADTIIGSENRRQGCDPAVQIQACNDIKLLMADNIIAGNEGTVNILAGLDSTGEVSGEYDADGNLIAGSIEKLIVGTISGAGGIVNIAAGGDIDLLKACRVVGDGGEVNIVADGDITVDIPKTRGCWWNRWRRTNDDGVEFTAGGQVNDLRNSIDDDNIEEGAEVEFPMPI